MTEATRLMIEAVAVAVVLSIIGALALNQYVHSRRNSPGAVSRLVKVTDEMSVRIEVLERKDQENYLLIVALQRELGIERDYSRALYAYSQRQSDHIRRLTEMLRQFVQDVPIAPDPPPVPQPVNSFKPLPVNRTLVAAITALFNRDEIDDLAFQLGINAEEIGGETAGKRARSLVDYARRHGMTEELVSLARQLRPEGDI